MDQYDITNLNILNESSDPVDEAVHMTLHNGKMSSADIAARISCSRQVLINKCNPSNDYHKLTLNQARAMMLATKDLRILHAMAEELGCTVQEPHSLTTVKTGS